MKPHFDAVRTLVHGQTDTLWNSRTPNNKLEVVVCETSRRLRGMAEILDTMAGAIVSRGGKDWERFCFLASSANDLALGLDRAQAEAYAHREAADWAAHLAEKKAARKGKKRGGGA
jgi:hypothetical protein